MSVPGQESGAYGGKKWGEENIPYVHPATPDSKCQCELCREARKQNQQEVG